MIQSVNLKNAPTNISRKTNQSINVVSIVETCYHNSYMMTRIGTCGGTKWWVTWEQSFETKSLLLYSKCALAKLPRVERLRIFHNFTRDYYEHNIGNTCDPNEDDKLSNGRFIYQFQDVNENCRVAVKSSRLRFSMTGAKGMKRPYWTFMFYNVKLDYFDKLL